MYKNSDKSELSGLETLLLEAEYQDRMLRHAPSSTCIHYENIFCEVTVFQCRIFRHMWKTIAYILKHRGLKHCTPVFPSVAHKISSSFLCYLLSLLGPFYVLILSTIRNSLDKTSNILIARTY